MRFMMMLGTLVVSSRQVIDTMLLCKMVYVVLFASFCLVCYAQNQLEQVRFSNINQLPCWRRSDGCQTGEWEHSSLKTIFYIVSTKSY